MHVFTSFAVNQPYVYCFLDTALAFVCIFTLFVLFPVVQPYSSLIWTLFGLISALFFYKAGIRTPSLHFCALVQPYFSIISALFLYKSGIYTLSLHFCALATSSALFQPYFGLISALFQPYFSFIFGTKLDFWTCVHISIISALSQPYFSLISALFRPYFGLISALFVYKSGIYTFCAYFQ